MSGIDPDDPAQQQILIDHLGWIPDSDEDWANSVLTQLRDHFAAQPRIVELPAEDRTRKWSKSDGAVWSPSAEGAGWVVNRPRVIRSVFSWAEILQYGPLTDAGPA